MGGYQLTVSMDIFRGRYRESLETPKPIAADKPLLYRFALPTANHVFLPGHRIMVQVQSSWFPLYDRNPQTFVPNIFWPSRGIIGRRRSGFTTRPGQASFVELPVVSRLGCEIWPRINARKKRELNYLNAFFQIRVHLRVYNSRARLKI